MRHASDVQPMRADRGAFLRRSAALLAAMMVAAFTIATAHAAPNAADSRPYDAKLLRLAELLGAVHYLRELCGANEGQFWRDTMMELMKSEGSSAIRRARMTRGFNQGYRNYSRTYNVCTPTAQSTIERFLAEGAEIADGLAAGGQ
jgi:uncharacterized protein (TIGR02301 family)